MHIDGTIYPSISSTSKSYSDGGPNLKLNKREPQCSKSLTWHECKGYTGLNAKRKRHTAKQDEKDFAHTHSAQICKGETSQ